MHRNKSETMPNITWSVKTLFLLESKLFQSTSLISSLSHPLFLLS